jgi:hypothetical protein
LNVDNVVIEPHPVRPQQTAFVSLDYEISGTPGDTIYVGIVAGDTCTAFYSGIPGSEGDSGHAALDLEAPCLPGVYDVRVAVAHVNSEQEFCQAVGDGTADTMSIGELRVESCADLNGDGIVNQADLGILLANWGRECP